MTWLPVLAHFFSGAFLANFVPHFVEGVSGRRFQTPFASPPSVGESSPIVNVLWGSLNFAVGYWLIEHFGWDAHVAGAGALLMALFLAFYFGRVRGGK